MKHIQPFEEFLNEDQDLGKLAESINVKYWADYNEDALNEDLPDGIIRVFKTKGMKDYIKDVPVGEIEKRGKDMKVKNYIVNTVVLKDGTKGWVWSENEKFED